MNSNEKFDIKSFISPSVSYAPVYVWVWNDICNQDIIDAQLSEMQKLGIRAFYILPEPKNFRPDSMPTNLSPDYLSSEYFELFAYAIKKAKSLSMNCWIYDEGGWPSGGACGEVLKAHPEYTRYTLGSYELSFSPGDKYIRSKPDVIAAFLNGKEIIGDGYIFTEDAVVTEYVAEKQTCEKTNYPDLLNKEATEYFIEITHEKYASAIQNELGKNVKAVFTDEPKAPSQPFSYELAEKYQNIYGESILSHLALIAQKATPTEENIHILYRWYDLCSRMFCDNFLLPCKKWANEHGMFFTGHMDKDHDPLGCMNGGGNFNLMRALRCFDIPGVDVIWRQLYPENKTEIKDDINAYNGFFPRYASSAAAQNGTKLAMSEIFGVAGASTTYDIMRYTVGYQAVRGINIFNPFNFPLGRNGQLLAQELPVFTQNQPYYQFLAQFNRYVERLSYISSLGKRICETGLYYPVHDFHGGIKAEIMAKRFDVLGRTLEEMTVDFDIVDDDVIQYAQGIDDGLIRIGVATYKHIIIPEGAFIPQETQNVLNRFVKGGGRISNTLTDPTPVIHIDGDVLRAMHRKAENADIYILFRECGDNGEYRIHLPSSNGFLLDLSTGELQRFKAENGIMQLSLAIGETAVILLTDDAFKAKNIKKYSNIFDISDNFTLCKENELNCNQNGFEIIKHSCKAIPALLGDWSYLIGNAYSGSAVYKTTFTLPGEKIGKEGLIDLGDVHFAAQIYINEIPLGTVLAAPYRLKVPADILKENNNLKIVVTNTSANWYLHTDFFDKWNVKELSPYFEAELNYAKDFISGGLFGPVVLYTE